MPTVSIIMPVYNMESYIEKAIISVLNQSFKDYELIIVNDGSTDKSKKIISNYSKVDSRIVVVDKKNGGISQARNTGINLAQGDYILFLDSDDEIVSNLLEITIEQANLYNSDIVMFGLIKDYMDANEQVNYSTFHKAKSSNYQKEQFPSIKMDLNFIDLIGYVCNKLYKRDIIMRKPHYFEKDLSLFEDMVFNTNILKTIESLTVLDDCLYHYKQRKRASLVNKFRENVFELYLRNIKCREVVMKDWKIEKNLVNKLTAQLYVSAIKSIIIIMFTKKNQLSLNEKKKYINFILTHPETKLRIKYFEPQTAIDFILKFIIKNEYALVLTVAGFLLLNDENRTLFKY